jgi:hypothetical protein
MSNLKRKIEIWAEVPRGVSYAELAQYVEEALGIWGGQRRPPGSLSDDDPGDPLFGSIKVNQILIGSRKFNFKPKGE